MDSAVQSLTASGDVLFLMLGAVMVFAMHAGFAFLEVGTVRKKKPNQCPGKNPYGLVRINSRLLPDRLPDCLRRSLLHVCRRIARRKPGI